MGMVEVTIILDAGGGVIVNEMKTKLPICLLFAMFCALFIGCSSPATDMNTSRQGALSTGRRFVFYGADRMDMTVEEFLEKGYFTYRRTEDFIIHEETIEAILERPELQIGAGHVPPVPPESLVIYVFYFAEGSDIFLTSKPVEGSWLGFPPAFVINLESGVVAYYVQRIPLWEWWK